MSNPVADGREALNHWFGYPWYDAKADGVRRVELSRPWSGEGKSPLDWASFDLSSPLWQWLAWTAIALVLAGVAYLLLRAYLGRQRRAGMEEEGPAGEPDHVELLPVPVPKNRADLLAEARRHYEQGDYAQAIVYLFSYQLVQLDRYQIIRLGRGKTNRQYLREVGRGSGLCGLVEQTMIAFEEVFFGRRTLDRAAFERCWLRQEEFDTLVQAAM